MTAEAVVHSRARTSAGARLWERETALEAVGALVDGLRAGSGGVLFLVAEAGLGKTTLLHHAVALAGPGVLVGVGRGDPLESRLPFGMVAQALEALGAEDVLGLPASAWLDGDVRAAQLYGVLRWLEAHRHRPVLLALDDLHWADPDSLAVVSFLSRRLPALGCGLVATMRPWPAEAYQVASALAQAGDARLERLSPLSDKAAAALMASRLGRLLPEAAVGPVQARCAGNPLLLEQIATTIDEDEGPASAGGPARRPRELLLGRFAGLPPAGLEFAQAASVFGVRFSAGLAAEVSGVGAEVSEASLEALWRTGLVRQAGGGAFEFVHPLFHEALYDEMAPSTRARLHARAFDVLMSRGREADAAEHAVRGRLGPDPRAIVALEAAGREALEAGAVATAVVRLEAACRLSGEARRRPSPELPLALAQALVAAGRPGEAVEIYEQALEDQALAPDRRADVTRRLARALALAGEHDDATARFEEAVELACAQHPGLATEALLDQALAGWLTGGPARALPLTVEARRLARGARRDVARRARAAWGFVASLGGDPAGLAVLEAAAAPVAENPLAHPGEVQWSWGALGLWGRAATYSERFEQAAAAFEAGLDAARRLQAPEAFASLAIGSAFLLARQGRLAEALERVEGAGALGDLAPMNQTYVAVLHAYVLHLMGRAEESCQWCHRAEGTAVARGEWVAMLFLWDLAGQRHLAEGRPGEACASYDQARETSARLGIGEPCVVPWAGHAVAAYLACGRTADVEGVLEWLQGCRLPCRWPRIVAARARAGLVEAQGDPVGAEEQFRNAVALHHEVDLPLERGETLFAYASFLRRRGDTGGAGDVLAEALEIAQGAGAGWLADRARQELPAVGRRRRRRPDELTPAERRVAQLAAAGLSNQEIATQLVISVTTVETHLRRVFSKLGISSRRQLMTMDRARIQKREP